jgi:hypothetical protein
MLAIKYRVSIAVAYVGLGVFLLKFAYFTPWYPMCWIWFGGLLGWAVAGIAFDPFRFFTARLAPSAPPSAVTRVVRRWPVFFFSLLLISPLMAWVTHFWWFFPWLPWWSLSPYWIGRELLLATLFVVLVRLVWSTLTTGRQLCILLAFLLASHLALLLTYAGISGGPDYLRDGVTQDCFLMQLWFKTLVGILVFFTLEIWSRRRDVQQGAAGNSRSAEQLTGS